MNRLSVFNHVTVDGYFAGPNGEIDWFKTIPEDEEWKRYTHQQASGESSLMFGRATYEMMKSWWPTPAAIEMDPGMAKAVNHSPKIVFSKTVTQVEEGPNWKNVRLYHEIDPDEIVKMKRNESITILGSGTIVRQLTELNLIDEYNLVVAPIVLGAGISLFQDIHTLNLKLLESRSFQNGITFLRYAPLDV